MMPESIQVEIYSRPNCHLCDEAKAVIKSFSERYPIEITMTDVDSDPRLQRDYGLDIPVILLNGAEVCRHRVNPGDFEKKLGELWNKSMS